MSEPTPGELTVGDFRQLLWSIRTDDELLGQIDDAIVHDAALRQRLTDADARLAAQAARIVELEGKGKP